MKNITIFYFWIVTVMLLFFGCKSEISIDVRDGVEESEFFSDKNDLVLAVNDLYSDLPDIESIYLSDSKTDNLVTSNSTPEKTGSRIVPTARGSGGWNWSNLRKINWVINNSNKIQDNEFRNHYVGVARWFRAYFYFEMVKRFGDVPWINSVLKVEDEESLKMPRTERTIIIDSILADLDFAIDNIPEEKKLNEITRYTALALKSRVGLYEGTYQKYHGLNGKFDDYLRQSASSSEALINSGAYDIFDDFGPDESYRLLFARDNQDKTETILANQYDASRKRSNYGGRLTKSTWG